MRNNVQTNYNPYLTKILFYVIINIGGIYEEYNRDNKWYANITINKVRKTRVFKTENEAIKWRREMEVMPQCLNK